VFTVEYLVRSAQAAVYALFGLKREPPAVYKGNSTRASSTGVHGPARPSVLAAACSASSELIRWHLIRLFLICVKANRLDFSNA